MSQQRRHPEQSRSRLRVDAIVEAATTLVVREGNARFSMSDLAKEAGVSMPSIYRYFGDKSAVLAALAQRQSEASYERLRAAILLATEGADLRDVCATGLRAFFQSARADPVHRYVAAAVQADPKLEHLHVQDARRHAALMTKLLASHFEGSDIGIQADDLALLFVYLAGALAQLASLVDEAEADRLEHAYITVALQLLAVAR